MKSLVSLITWFNLYRSPVGRRLFAFRGVRDALRAADASVKLDELIKLVQEAIKHDLMTQELIARSVSPADKPESKEPRSTSVIDSDVDRTLGAIHAVLVAKNRALRGAAATAAAVRRILHVAFPNGVIATILLTYPEEAAAVARLVAMMLPADDPRSLALESPEDEQWDWRGKLHEDVVQAGLEDLVNELADLHAEFDAALKREKPSPEVGKDEARAANATGQEYLLGLFAAIVGSWPRPTEQDAAARGALLKPILDQNDAIAAYYRRNRKPKDVNPETGETVEVPEGLDVVDVGDVDIEPKREE